MEHIFSLVFTSYRTYVIVVFLPHMLLQLWQSWLQICILIHLSPIYGHEKNINKFKQVVDRT